MKFSVLSGDLLKVLTKTGSVVPAKSTMPILENYLFTLKDDELTITANDLEISISSSIKVKGDESGSIVVPAKRVMDTIRALPNINIKFSADLSNLKILIETDKGEYRLTGQLAEEFPSPDIIKEEENILLNTGTLKRLINKTLFATSTDELRPAMTGVYFQIMKEEIRAVSTDGHRLVKLVTVSPRTEVKDKNVIIPNKTLNIISKHFDEELNSISVNESHISFNFGDTILLSRLIDEKYPNYDSVIPSENNVLLSINRNELLSSVKRASLYASTTTHQIRFSLEKNELTISAEDIDFGSESKEKILCEYTNDNFEIGFNANYLLDILSHIDSIEIEFLFSSSNRAAIVKPKEQSENEDLLMLVMPVRLNV